LAVGTPTITSTSGGRSPRSARDANGNAEIEQDQLWEPLAVTPNFPEYPSGHTCATAAVAHAMEDFFPGGVRIPARNVVTGEERFYTCARDVVDDVVEAGMLIGVPFRSVNEDGTQLGRRIARQNRSRSFQAAPRIAVTLARPRYSPIIWITT
jgi:hypothetical protein